MYENKLRKSILNLKAIRFACSSAAQEDTDRAIISINEEAQEALDFAIAQLEKKLSRRIRKNLSRG